MALIHLVMQHLNLNVYHELNGQVYEISNRVDFDDEASVPTWLSQVILLAIGVSGFVLAFMHTLKSAKRVWFTVGAIGVMLSLDEVAAIHELALQLVHLTAFKTAAPTLFANAWILLLPFILIFGLILLWQVIKYTPKRTVAILMTGAIFILVGAIFIDILTNANNANTFYEKGILVGIEETLEMVGYSIVLYSLLNYIETSFGDRIRAARHKLRG